MYMRRGGPPEPIKSSDVKVGDAIAAMGEMDDAAKSVGAVMVMELDPDTAKRMEEMRANYGKTWLTGRVTAIKDTTVTVEGGPDNAAHTFVADENTDFRKRRDPITLADIQVGDPVRVEGAIKNGQFVATSVNVMMPRAERRPSPPPGPPAAVERGTEGQREQGTEGTRDKGTEGPRDQACGLGRQNCVKKNARTVPRSSLLSVI